MKLHELSPAARLRKSRLGARAEVPAPATARPPARVTRVRTLVPAAVYDPDLKAVSSRFTENFRREASTTSLQ